MATRTQAKPKRGATANRGPTTTSLARARPTVAARRAPGTTSKTRAKPAPAKVKAVAVPRPSAAPAAVVAAQLARVRAMCAALPGVSERPSHGSPAFFVGKKTFAYFLDNHHGDGRLALWCAAPPGAQAMLVDTNADHYFVPPYVGHQGWIGVRLDRGAGWPEIAAVLEAAYDHRTTKRAR